MKKLFLFTVRLFGEDSLVFPVPSDAPCVFSMLDLELFEREKRPTGVFKKTNIKLTIHNKTIIYHH